MKAVSLRFKANIVTILACLMAFFSPAQTPPEPLSLLLKEMLDLLSTRPEEQGANWKKWATNGRRWNTLLATGTGADPARADLLVALQDSLPLIALVATSRSGKYDHLRIDESLCGGWRVSLYAEDGRIAWSEWTRGAEKFYVFAGRESGRPQWLAMPQADGTYLLLSWDRYGDTFEQMLIYDPWVGSIRAGGPFALQTTLIRQLFVKTDADYWLELVYRQDRLTAVALHRERPGRLQSVLLDLDRDGKMDVLSNVSAFSESMTIRKINKPLPGNDPQSLQMIKKDLVEKAASAQLAWREAQEVWERLQIPEAVLPGMAGL